MVRGISDTWLYRTKCIRIIRAYISLLYLYTGTGVCKTISCYKVLENMSNIHLICCSKYKKESTVLQTGKVAAMNLINELNLWCLGT